MITENMFFVSISSIRPEVSCKKGILKNFTKDSPENTCVGVSFLIKLQAPPVTIFKKATLAHVVSCEFCEIFQTTFFYRTSLGDCFYRSWLSVLFLYTQFPCLLMLQDQRDRFASILNKDFCKRFQEFSLLGE